MHTLKRQFANHEYPNQNTEGGSRVYCYKAVYKGSDCLFFTMIDNKLNKKDWTGLVCSETIKSGFCLIPFFKRTFEFGPASVTLNNCYTHSHRQDLCEWFYPVYFVHVKDKIVNILLLAGYMFTFPSFLPLRLPLKTEKIKKERKK